MPTPATNLTLLITDLHLGGTPLLLRDLALALSHIAPALPGITPDHYKLSIISLKPLPPEPIENRNLKIGGGENPTIPQQLTAAGIPVHSLNMTNPLHLPRALRQLTQLLEQQKPDALYSMLIHANLLATLAHRRLKKKRTHTPKLIHSIHTLQPKPKWHWTLQGKLNKHRGGADALIVPAQPILDKLSQYGPIKRGGVIPNGIDIDRFANALPIPPNELPWPPDAPVIGYIGRFDPVKNLPLLLRAFALLHSPKPTQNPEQTWHDTGMTTAKSGGVPGMTWDEDGRKPHLALLGYGPQEAELKTLTNSLHLAPHVHFLGPTTTPERWYKSFTCHCLPSSVEGFGLTLLESLAAGTPIIALDTPIIRPLLQPFPEATLLPTPTSPESLAHALHQVIAKYHLPPLGPTSPSFATLSYLRATYSTTQMVDLHRKFLKKIINSTD